MIQEYFSQIELILQDFPNIRSLSVTKKIYNAKQGCIGGSVIFENGYRLDFVEVKDIDVKPKIKYRYQYMDESQDLIFRYDNAPHHRDIALFLTISIFTMKLQQVVNQRFMMYFRKLLRNSENHNFSIRHHTLA